MNIPDFIATMAADQHHMELWGMGPELWADRANGWVEAGWSVLDHFVTKFGVLAIATIAMIQTVRAKAAVKEAVKETHDRLDRQARRIDEVALAVPATTNGHTVVEHAQVEIEPEPKT